MGSSSSISTSRGSADGATGGYAAISSPEFREAQLAKFRELARGGHRITTALIPGRDAPKLWLEDMVASMKAGSVIVDLAAERGGNCDLTVMDEKVVSENDVTVVGYTDFPSRMGTQASLLYATNIRHMMADLTPEKDGVVDHNMEDDVIRGATITHQGEVTFPPPPPKVQAIAAKSQKTEGADAGGEARARSRRLQGADQAAGDAARRRRGADPGRGPRRPGQLHAALHRLRPVGLRRLPGHLGCGAQPAHAADGGDERDLLDHHSRRPDAIGSSSGLVVFLAMIVFMTGITSSAVSS